MKWIVLFLLCAFTGLMGCSTLPGADDPASPKKPPELTATPALRGETLLASADSPTAASSESIPATSLATSSPMPDRTPTLLANPQATPTSTPTPDPENWMEWPVIPTGSQTTRVIYQRGLELGNRPGAFSKVGDCGSTPAWFLGDFDRGPKFYQLGDYQNLSDVIESFSGSFGRTTLAGKAGFNASSVFAPLWADRKQCQNDEGPLACELRVQRPSFVFIMLGSNDVYHLDEFEPQMRKMIEYTISLGIVPILTTKADNIEKDHQINSVLARLASEYDIPLWNYWRAVQSLPNQGLQEDGVHLTWAPNRFNDPEAMKSAWTVRNLTALQTLDSIWRFVTATP
jgi:hypothetical protein